MVFSEKHADAVERVMKNSPKALINITTDHFVGFDGNSVLVEDEDGTPRVSSAAMSSDDRALGNIALALYENGQRLSRDQIDLVVRWARQFKYFD